MKEFTIGNKIVRDFGEPLIIAEVGANFNGDMELLKKMVVRAKEVGVGVVKFQSWRKETITVSSSYCNKPAEITAFGHTRQEDLLDYLSLSEKQLWEIKDFCDTQKILFSSTPISFHDVDVLVDMDVPFIKIASMDLNHLTLIKYIAEKGKPVIMSTGMGSIEEITKAVETIDSTGNEQLILLHCTALYPPSDEEVNLNNIDSLRETFDCLVGYSDHSLGCGIPLAAVAKGAVVIEKHYTLDKSMVGWDHAVSATPEEFEIIVRESKSIVKALGEKERQVGQRELEKRKLFRRSIVAKRSLPVGTRIQFDDIDFKRPGIGISPDQYLKVIGRTLACDVDADQMLKWEYFE